MRDEVSNKSGWLRNAGYCVRSDWSAVVTYVTNIAIEFSCVKRGSIHGLEFRRVNVCHFRGTAKKSLIAPAMP